MQPGMPRSEEGPGAPGTQGALVGVGVSGSTGPRRTDLNVNSSRSPSICLTFVRFLNVSELHLRKMDTILLAFQECPLSLLGSTKNRALLS